MTDLASVRTLLVHDWVVQWGGAERVLPEILALVPNADVVVGVMHPDRRSENSLTRRARETWLARLPLARTHHRWFVPLHYSAFRSIDTSAYDLVISSATGFAKAVRPRPGRPHVCYCNSPPRYLWDLAQAYRTLAGGVRGTLLGAAAPMLRALDRRSAMGVTHFIANTEHVAGRIRRAYGRDAAVVYPPAERKPAPPAGAREDFLLVLGRLVAYKRVDLAIRAAERLGRRLVVAGDGPERQKLERLAGLNTTFLGEVDEPHAGELLERCAAFVFCGEEDFGIAPVEANLHGAPVVGFGRGGLVETMVSGDTAVFFERQEVDAVAAAIERASGMPWDHAKIRANGARFSPARFRASFGAELKRALEGA